MIIYKQKFYRPNAMLISYRIRFKKFDLYFGDSLDKINLDHYRHGKLGPDSWIEL